MYNRLKVSGRLPRYKKEMPPGLSNSYIRRIHMVLRAALQQAVDERLINHNPCENCRIPPKEKKELKIIPPEKGGAYLRAVEVCGVLPINKLLLERADIDTDVMFHDLRHTFATMAMQSGVDVNTLSSMLGHYSAGFTLDTYAHVTDQMQYGAAQKIGGFMEQATGNTPEPPTTSPAEKTKYKIIPFQRVV